MSHQQRVFLSVQDVLYLHQQQIQLYGGAVGVRDLALLESAVQSPRASFGGEYLNPTIHDQASAYAFSIINNHPFIDGNKRSGAASAYAFLHINRYRLITENDTFYHAVASVADGTWDKHELTRFIRRTAKPWDRAET